MYTQSEEKTSLLSLLLRFSCFFIFSSSREQEWLGNEFRCGVAEKCGWCIEHNSQNRTAEEQKAKVRSKNFNISVSYLPFSFCYLPLLSRYPTLPHSPSLSFAMAYGRADGRGVGGVGGRIVGGRKKKSEIENGFVVWERTEAHTINRGTYASHITLLLLYEYEMVSGISSGGMRDVNILYLWLTVFAFLYTDFFSFFFVFLCLYIIRF